jgi:hypothetical protein
MPERGAGYNQWSGTIPPPTRNRRNGPLIMHAGNRRPFCKPLLPKNRQPDQFLDDFPAGWPFLNAGVECPIEILTDCITW